MGNEAMKKGARMGSRKRTILLAAAVLAIVVLALVLRTHLLQYYGFFEPDGYYHYAVIEAAIHNGYSVPANPPLSGWPPNCNIVVGNSTCSPAIPHGEPVGFYMLTLIPYLILGFLGISAYSIMRIVPVIFGLLGMLFAYILAMRWSNNKGFGILTMLFVAVSMANISKTEALSYRGDAFATVFLLAALIVTLAMLDAEKIRTKLTYLLGAALLLSLCNLVWNGAAFATAVYAFAIMLILLYGFVFKNRKLVSDSVYMSGVLLLWFALVSLFNAIGLIRGQTFTGPPFFLALLLLSIAVYAGKRMLDLGMDERVYVISTAKRRLALAAIVALASTAVISLAIPGYLGHIAGLAGYNGNNNLLATIQELFRPSPLYFWNSFGLQNLMTPLGPVMMLAAALTSGSSTAMWVVLLFFSMCYLFMQINKENEGENGEQAAVRFAPNTTTLVLISYFSLTAYLQMSAIRFGYLISIPMAIFSAFTLYWLFLYLRRWKAIRMASIAVGIVIVVFVCYASFNSISGIVPSDSINTQFIQALAWMHNNTPSNSVVLTLWPEGSVVEGVANRTSVTDSVTAQSIYKTAQFAAWLYDSGADPAFLLANITGAPDYLLVRQMWMNETLSIFLESNITEVNSSAYGYTSFSRLTELTNSTSKVYKFFNGAAEADMVVATNKSGGTVSAYFKSGSILQPFRHIAFYNTVTGNWSVANQTSTGDITANNFTFLVLYSPVNTAHGYLNVTAAYALSPSLASSNMVKFLFQCNTLACSWDNNVASLKLVYINLDTKIFQIEYNMSNASVAADVAEYPRV